MTGGWHFQQARAAVRITADVSAGTRSRERRAVISEEQPRNIRAIKQPYAQVVIKRPESVAAGVEEEFHVVDLKTRRLTARADSLVEQLPVERYRAELQRSVVEANSRPCVRLVDLAEDIAALRRAVIAAADPLGLGIVAAGTVPIADPDALKVTPDPRYENMLDEYRMLVHEQLICSAQVHIDVSDRDLAVAVGHRVEPWLPPLLALSASSPYWLGIDTGYASYRTLVWRRWPTTGALGGFESAADYERTVADLVRAGVISDPGMIYFDVRPSAHLSTVELRICDACPHLEDVVLIAGLFRSLVIREIDAVIAGTPPMTARPEVLQGATWRAARSGLEGNLVDPATATPVPAHQLVRGVLGELRPTLESTGDWELVAELTECALARGSSSARQRAACASGGLPQVVDMLVAETRANTDWLPGAGPDRKAVSAMLRGYATAGDEAILFDGSARGPYGLVMSALDRIGIDGLRERQAYRDKVQRQMGMIFNVAGEDEERLFPIDLIPRVVPAEDWRLLQGGLTQRIRGLEAFLHDAYGERAVIRDGVLPSWAVDDSPGLRESGHHLPRSAVRCLVAGFDLVRDGAGRWAVLEDNLRVPSGVGYAIADRWLAARVLPELIPTSLGLTPGPKMAVRALRSALTATSSRVALVTAGAVDPAFYEHQLLARVLEVPLVRPGELWVADDGVWIDGPEPARVEVLYRRIDEDELFGAKGADGNLLGPGLLERISDGRLVLANAPGNGVADDKSLYAYVPKLIEYYLGEQPLIDSVPTYLCRDPESLALVLDRLAELVIKPVCGSGGRGVVIGPDATPAELRKVRAHVVAEPARWIAQETVSLSTHPTLVEGRLEPRAVDLRGFVCLGGQPVVVPIALTRVAPCGSRIVNSSRGGGAKDTWLMY